MLASRKSVRRLSIRATIKMNEGGPPPNEIFLPRQYRTLWALGIPQLGSYPQEMKPTATRARGTATSSTHTTHELAIRVSNHPSIVVRGSLASSWAALHARMLPFLCGFCLSRHHLRTHGKTGDGHLRIWASTYDINIYGFHRTVRPSCARATVKQLAICKILNFYCAF